MGLFDRGADDESAEVASAAADSSGDDGDDAPPGTAGEPSAGVTGDEGSAEVAVEASAGPSYVRFDRYHPPEAVVQRYGDRDGDVDDEVLDTLEAYVTDAGTIREDVLGLPLAVLEEWVDVERQLGGAKFLGGELSTVVEHRTVEVSESLPEDDFFRTDEGFQTVANRYDLERAVPFEKKRHFAEIDRYWVNKPYAFVVIFKSTKENETKYYLVEPHLTPIELEIRDFLSEKLRAAIKYETDDVLAGEDEDDQDVRANVIERETRRLLKRFDLYGGDVATAASSRLDGLKAMVGPLASKVGVEIDTSRPPRELEGIRARPEPAILEDDARTLTEYQVDKLLYYLKRDFVGYERIDGIKHDINVEDISCDGYNSPVFVYHTDHENIITNVYHGEDELDAFVVKLAQRSGKGISKRTPQVDATLPDGSRSQLTLGREVSDHGTNYTIRQFKDVPFTPIDLINWRTFSLDQMAFLWLAIENNKSLIFAGGTASGKTTSLNAVSLFIPSNAKIVSIEDTREVELPQRNWIASVTRPSFSDDAKGDIDEFDLLEAALRQRPDYIVMGEIRGEEGRTLFQVMSTGHTTYTTFHADTVGEVLKRFTTEPINVSKTLFTALDLVSIQRQTRVQGQKVRRSASITEINEYNAENDEINVKDVFQWRAETDEFEHLGRSNLVDQIMFDRGWSDEELQAELDKRRLVLAYLVDQRLSEYSQVAASIQAFMSDQDTLLTLIAHDALESSLEDLREMESVLIDIDPEKEALVPRPTPPDDIATEAEELLESVGRDILEPYRDQVPESGAIGRMLRQAAERAERTQSAELAAAFEASPGRPTVGATSGGTSTGGTANEASTGGASGGVGDEKLIDAIGAAGDAGAGDDGRERTVADLFDTEADGGSTDETGADE